MWQRDAHLSWQSAGSGDGFVSNGTLLRPSATMPQASKEKIRDQSRPTLTNCDRSVLPLFGALQHCAGEAMLASTTG